jgi:hypothetical protein
MRKKSGTKRMTFGALMMTNMMYSLAVDQKHRTNVIHL